MVEDLWPQIELTNMAMSSLRFAVGVAGAVLVTLLASGGKMQSGVGATSRDYSVKPKCEGQYNLAYRIDWDHGAYEGGSAQRAAKQSHPICD